MGQITIKMVKIRWLFWRTKLVYLIDDRTWRVKCESCDVNMCEDVKELLNSPKLREMLKKYDINSDKLH